MLSDLLSIGQLLPIALIVVIVKETTTIVDQVASGLKDSTGVDLPSLLSGLLANSDIDAGSAESLAD